MSPKKDAAAGYRQDVCILREGFEKFRAACLAQAPMLEPLDFLTFPSYNNALFRTKYMPEKALCMLPPLGYSHRNRLYSVSSMAWLRFMEVELGLVYIRTARKGGEINVGGHWVDGAGADASGHKHVLNYHGCYW